MRVRAYIPGIVFICIIALFSSYLSTLHASFDALAISIIIGMLFGNLLGDRSYFKEGAEIGIRALLPAGIALYGTQLSLSGMNAGLLFSIFLVSAGLFGLTFALARVFHINKRLTVLLASGLSICGASAIAVISPLIGAKREDTSLSILAVMMLGLTGMIFYPLLSDSFSLTQDEFNFFAGATLPMIGQVKVAAGPIFSAGVTSALHIKLVRVSFLLFMIPLTVFLSNREEKKVRVPWFAVAFVLIALITNGTSLLKGQLDLFKTISTFCLSASLAAIGFSVDFDAIVEEGVTPLGVIAASWTVVLIIIYFLRNIL